MVYERQKTEKPEAAEGEAEPEETVVTYNHLAILDATTLAVEYDGQVGGKGKL